MRNRLILIASVLSLLTLGLSGQTKSTVVTSHINEAATAGGLVVGDRLKRFLQLVDRRTALEIPLSGVVMEFDGRGRRVNQ